MYCPYCRNTIRKGTMICAKCGADLREEMPVDSQPSSMVANEAAPKAAQNKPDAVAAAAAPPPQPQTPGISRSALLQQAKQANIGMKWYLFLIYFSLFASSLICVGDALRCFSLANTYDSYGAIQGLLNFESFGLLAFGALYIYMRYILANFKKVAVNRFLIFLIAQIAFYILINMILFNILPSNQTRSMTSAIEAQWVEMITTTVIQIIYFFCNGAYFTKRTFLFVND